MISANAAQRRAEHAISRVNKESFSTQRLLTFYRDVVMCVREHFPRREKLLNQDEYGV
jgi:hypothetical protein